jgi:DNA-binding SARP family transcriptional activator
VAPAFRILGPLDVVIDGRSLPLGGPKQRAVLALLLVDHGHVVSIDRIGDALWGDQAGDQTRNLIQVYVSNIRRALEPAAAAFEVDGFLRTQRPGYLIEVPDDELDLAVFERLAALARRNAQQGDARTASAQLLQALDLWRGPALADVADEEPSLSGTVTRLEAARHTAAVDRAELELDLGHHAEVLEESAGLVAADPLDERARGIRMLALYRSGRQADALACYQEGRRHLVDELGIEPGPQLRALEDLILQQSPELDGPASAGGVRELSTMFGTSIVAPRAVLIVDDRRIPLDRTVTTIGRRADRTIALDDTRASRSHAEVRRRGDGYVVVDTGSTNGTRVNGTRIDEPTALQPGDEITIGSTVLRFDES